MKTRKKITIRLRLTNKQELLKNMQTAYNKCIKKTVPTVDGQKQE